jgi:hypothetical protein
MTMENLLVENSARNRNFVKIILPQGWSFPLIPPQDVYFRWCSFPLLEFSICLPFLKLGSSIELS